MGDLPSEIHRHAVVSDCGRYRFRLSRWWGPGRALTFCVLHPSTADTREDDPTIRRCMGFARDFGYDGIHVVNLFPWRATDPRDLVAAHRRGEDVACRETRDSYIAGLVLGLTRPIAAWGAHPLARDEWRTVLADHPDVRGDVRWMCLGVTKAGAPRHPLYLPRSARPVAWEVPP